MRGLPKSMLWRSRAFMSHPKRQDTKVLVIAEPLAMYMHISALLFLHNVQAVQGSAFFKKGGVRNLHGPLFTSISSVIVVANQKLWDNDVENIIRHFGNIPILVLSAWGYVSIKSENRVIHKAYRLRHQGISKLLGSLH